MIDLSRFNAHTRTDREHSRLMHDLQLKNKLQDYMNEVGGTSRRTALKYQILVLKTFVRFKQTLKPDPEHALEIQETERIIEASRKQL